jgi:hypothetical protein
MPDEYKVEYCDDAPMTNTVMAYRKYYANAKNKIAKWNKTRPMPNWYANGAYKIDDGIDFTKVSAFTNEPDYVNRAD